MAEVGLGSLRIVANQWVPVNNSRLHPFDDDDAETDRLRSRLDAVEYAKHFRPDYLHAMDALLVFINAIGRISLARRVTMRRRYEHDRLPYGQLVDAIRLTDSQTLSGRMSFNTTTHERLRSNNTVLQFQGYDGNDTVEMPIGVLEPIDIGEWRFTKLGSALRWATVGR